MENSNSNSFLEVTAGKREIVAGLKGSVFTPGSIRLMGQNIFSLGTLRKEGQALELSSLANVGLTVLKIFATVALSGLIILGLVGFFPLVLVSNNILLEVMLPLSFYQGICVFGLYAMWSPMKGWGHN